KTIIRNRSAYMRGCAECSKRHDGDRSVRLSAREGADAGRRLHCEVLRDAAYALARREEFEEAGRCPDDSGGEPDAVGYWRAAVPSLRRRVLLRRRVDAVFG